MECFNYKCGCGLPGMCIKAFKMNLKEQLIWAIDKQFESMVLLLKTVIPLQ